MKAKKKSSKITLIILLTAVFLFIVYNIVWGLVIQNKYGVYITGMDEIYALRTYAIADKDGYTYNVKIPDYLSYTGNLGVQPSSGGECALLIWPGIGKETEFGVFIPTENGRMRAVKLTRDGTPLENAPDEVVLLVEQNRDKIDTLFEKAEEMWGGLY